MKILLQFIMTVFLGSTVYAQTSGGYDHGNGGDACENSFKIVRDNLVAWILKGGAKDLTFPKGVTHEIYSRAMIRKMSTAKVSCTDKKLFVGKSEKTCKNFTAEDGTERIECNNNRFLATVVYNQYILVHHEYAGLAGFEMNDGEDSNYKISNQIVRNLASTRLKTIKLTLEFIAKAAILPEQEPKDHSKKNNAICLFIGRINHGDIVQELYQDLTSLTGATTSEQFPGGTATFDKLRTNVMGLKNYCVEGIAKEDPQPIAFEDVQALLQRIREIQQQITTIESYLDKRFP